MDAQNLVLEIGESESAVDVQARLNKAGDDGFFLVNVVGRLAFLRTSITQKQQPEQKGGNNGGGPKTLPDDSQARAYVLEHADLSVRQLIKGLSAIGITRKKSWVSDARLDITNV
jgi:hypothetical protein